MTSSAPSQVTYDSGYMWLVLLAVVLSNITGPGALVGMTSVLAREYPVILDKPQTETNIIGSIAFGIFLFVFPLVDLFCKQFGSRVTSGVGSFLMVSGLIVSGFCSKLWQFVIGYSLLMGTGAAFILLASVVIIHQYCQRYKSFGFALIGFGISVGVVVYPLILKAIKTSGANFSETALYLSAITALTITAPIIYKPRLKKDEQRAETSISRATFLKPLKRCHTPVYLLQSFLRGSVFVGFLILLFTQVSGHYGPEMGTLSTTLYGVGQLCASVIAPLVLIKFEPSLTAIQIFILLLSSSVMFVFGAVTNLYVYCIAAGIAGFCYGVIVALLPGHAYFLYKKDEFNMAYAFQQAVAGLGGIIGPIAATHVKALIGSSETYYFLGGLAILGGILLGVNAAVRPSILQPANPSNMSQEKKIETIKKDKSDTVPENYDSPAFTEADLIA